MCHRENTALGGILEPRQLDLLVQNKMYSTFIGATLPPQEEPGSLVCEEDGGESEAFCIIYQTQI